ncbi:MAG: hypothetical protein OEV62_05045 [Actinomycetota bacterium]|nr:hypothetical protein [Actinomycetota bacterium]
MPHRRAHPVAVQLKDGRVLVAGGETSLDGRCKKNADLFDPRSNEWTAAAPMHRDRCSASAVLLGNGTVLVAGGLGLVWKDEPGSHGWFTHYRRSVEIYHPRRDRWTRGAPMAESRALPILEMLDGRRVLMTGGQTFRHRRTSAQLYLVRQDRWRDTAPMSVSRDAGSSVRLRGGGVLVAGGPKDAEGFRTAERYSVASGTWKAAGRFGGTRFPILIRTPRGDVWAIPNSARPARRMAYRFDPGTSAWHRAGLLPAARTGTAVVTLRGQPFVLGGAGSNDRYTTRTTMLWRPKVREWQRWTRLPRPLVGHAAVRLHDGSILVLGGQTEISAGSHVPRKLAYRYYP